MGAFAGGFWLGRDQGVEIAASKDKARLEKLLKQQEDELIKLRILAKRKPNSEASTTQVGELTFYNELPKQSVKPASLHGDSVGLTRETAMQQKMRQLLDKEIKKEMLAKEKTVVAEGELIDAVPISAAPAVASHASYHLQVASFALEKAAKDFVSKLASHGYKAEIQSVDLPKLGTRYRVYIGDYADKDVAKEALKKVKEDLKVTGFIVRRD